VGSSRKYPTYEREANYLACSVDNNTDRKMHDIIFDEFAEQTVVAILHRREQLHRFDRVAVIENGKLVSIGKPSNVNLET